MARRIVAVGVFALGACVGGAKVAGAQQGLLGAGAAYFGLGVSGIGTGELDDRLAAQGYPTFGSTPAAVNLGAYRALSNGLMLGGEWHGLMLGEEEHEGREVGIGGGYGTLGVGYLVELSPRARVYPRLGLGGGGLGMWIETESGEAGFDEVLGDPEAHVSRGRDAVLSRAGAVLDLGAGVEILPGGRGRGPLIGLRLGYLLAPSGSDWSLDMGEGDAEASGGPSTSIGGLYVRVLIGGGWGR